MQSSCHNPVTRYTLDSGNLIEHTSTSNTEENMVMKRWNRLLNRVSVLDNFPM